MVSGVWGLLGALVTGAVGVLVLISCGTSSEGTVVAKGDQGVYDYACQAGGTVTGPVGVPMWETCSVPECWRLVVRDNVGNTSQPCVSREEYDRTQLGAVCADGPTAETPAAGIVLAVLADAIAPTAAHPPRPQTGAGASGGLGRETLARKSGRSGVVGAVALALRQGTRV